MGRIKSCNVNFGDSVIVGKSDVMLKEEANIEAQKVLCDTLEAVTSKGEGIIEAAMAEAEALIAGAKEQKAEIEVQKAGLEAQKAELEAQIEDIKLEAEQIRETAKKEGYQEGFDTGYLEGGAKIREEMSEKIDSVDLLATANFEIKKKILDSSRGDMFNLCFEICKKVGLVALDGAVLEEIINRTIRLLDAKTVVNVMISENLASKLEPDFSKKFQSVRIITNPKIADDSIIVESLSGNVDASISEQIERIAGELLNE